MNLLVALMVNHMNMNKADFMLNSHRVEEISNRIEVTSLLRRKLCQCCPGHTKSIEDPMSLDMVENGLNDIYPMV